MNQIVNVVLPVFVEFLFATFILIQIGGYSTVLFILGSVSAQMIITLWMIRHRRPLISELNDIEDASAEQTQEMLSKGLIFQQKDIDSFLKQLNIEPENKYYLPCSNLEMIKRILNNLVYSFEKLGYVDKVEELKRLEKFL